MGESGPGHLVLLVEGQGDVAAVPVLINRLLGERKSWDCLVLDKNPIRIGDIKSITGGEKNCDEWLRFLRVAGLRRKTVAVLVILDGDAERVENKSFCAAAVGRLLATRARATGAGTQFSVACVFAMQEFESWLIAGVESLAGRPLPDGREGVHVKTTAEGLAIEQSPRDAKGWLSRHMPNGYKATQDQALLTSMVNLDGIRARNLRSFRRLENALDLLIEAVRSGKPVVSPQLTSF